MTNRRSYVPADIRHGRLPNLPTSIRTYERDLADLERRHERHKDSIEALQARLDAVALVLGGMG